MAKFNAVSSYSHTVANKYPLFTCQLHVDCVRRRSSQIVTVQKNNSIKIKFKKYQNEYI